MNPHMHEQFAEVGEQKKGGARREGVGTGNLDGGMDRKLGTWR